MKVITAEDIRRTLSYERLLRELPPLLRAGAETPPRPVFDLPDGASLLLMPSWMGERDSKSGSRFSDSIARPPKTFGGVKIVHVTPGNAARDLPAVSASYLVFDGETNAHLALIDGSELTARRTAAVAAIAMQSLSKPDARRLLLVGSGRIASELPYAFRAARKIESVSVFSPTTANAKALVARLTADGFDASVCMDIAQQIPRSDLIACATLSQSPWIEGRHVTDQHVSLIGGFTPDMREADAETLRRARVYADTITALSEAGDLSGMDPADLSGTLGDLCATAFVRPEGLTVFKSVGEAAQDLAAATVLMR